MQKLTNAELGRPVLSVYQQRDKLPIVIVLDNVRSALNVGAVFRTSDAFLVHSIFLCGISATPPNKELSKTSLGAEESVQWKYFKETHEALLALKKEQFECWAVEQTTDSHKLNNVNLKSRKLAFVFGHEVYGVQQDVIDLCDGSLEVPQEGIKHSLNISVCTGVVCWEYYRQNTHHHDH